MDALYDDPALARFYDWDNPWPADFDWFLTLISSARSVLDLGCGTGIFSVALAERGAKVVGVDPAAAMLDIARGRPGGEAVRWIQAQAQGLDLGRHFEAVVMTGHAFQTLLTAPDRAACLATIARHLAPGGRFFFDSRNPEAREWEQWRPDATSAVLPHPDLGQVERWNSAEETEEPGVIAYQTHYRLQDGRHWQARSRIAFPGFDALQSAIAAAGLRVDRWYGDPAGGPIRPTCPDFIPVGGLR
jgi:SAM-dependent methyltransferase